MAQTNGKVQTRLTAFHATSTSIEVEAGWTFEDGAGSWELGAGCWEPGVGSSEFGGWRTGHQNG